MLMFEFAPSTRPDWKRVCRRMLLTVFPILAVVAAVAWGVYHPHPGDAAEAAVAVGSLEGTLHSIVWGLLAFVAVLVVVGGGFVAYAWEQREAVRGALAETQDCLSALCDTTDGPLFVWDAMGKFLDANQAFATLMGMSREALRAGACVRDLSTPQGKAMAQFFTSIERGSNGAGEPERRELAMTNPEGNSAYYVVSLASFRRNPGGEVAMVGRMTDCTKQKATEMDLLQIRAALDDSADAVLIADVTGTPTYINAVFGYWFGYTPDQMESINLDRIYGGPGRFEAIITPILNGENISEDLILTTYYERMFHVHLRGSAIVDEHFDVTGSLFLHTDVSEQKRLEAELEQLSRIDGLTGIHNRRSFDDRLTHEWRRARREQSRLSLIMLDIDAFKRYNDHYGHQEGDACLKQVAAGIAEIFQRPSDFVARYGGEEFAVIIADHGDALTVAQAERLRGHIVALALPHADSPTADVVTVSIGLAAMAPGETGDEQELIRLADEALYRAKERGRNRVCQNGIELPLG